jgi:DNA primase
MVRYSDELIDEIRNSNDIVAVVSQYVSLKRSGSNYMGLCPFHSEKSPSFSVSPNKQIFHCFGCGVGGNVIHFVSKIENIGFKETLEILARNAGITLPTIDNGEEDKKQKLKSKVYEINKFTAEFYHQNLYKPTSKIAQEYIKKRKMDNNTLKSFLIGYAGNYDELYRALKAQGFTDEEIFASSLVKRADNGKIYDSYRKRLMIPIKDVNDRVIAFGGRVLDDSKPKYINSPENIVYSKGRNLFGLNIAKKYDTSRLLIVEGYMDAISLYQRGITNVVASLGTALTENQGRLLRKYAGQVILGYDSDGAGQAAIIRGLDILSNMGCDIRVLQMEGAKDPDEYIIKYGSGRLLKLMDEAISTVEYKIKVLKRNMVLNSTSDKIKFLNEIAKIIVTVDNNIEQEIYIDKVSNEYKISKEAIYAQINKLKYGGKNPQKILEEPSFKKKSKNIDENVPEDLAKRESLTVALLINYGKEAYDKIKNSINPEDFKIEQNKKIIQKMYEEFEKRKQ